MTGVFAWTDLVLKLRERRVHPHSHFFALSFAIMCDVSREIRLFCLFHKLLIFVSTNASHKGKALRIPSTFSYQANQQNKESLERDDDLQSTQVRRAQGAPAHSPQCCLRCSIQGSLEKGCKYCRSETGRKIKSTQGKQDFDG